MTTREPKQFQISSSHEDGTGVDWRVLVDDEVYIERLGDGLHFSFAEWRSISQYVENAIAALDKGRARDVPTH